MRLLSGHRLALEHSRARGSTREQQRPRAWDGAQAERIRALGADLERVWYARSTEDRDRKELLRALLEEVIIAVERELCFAHITLRWRSGTLTQLDVAVPRFKVTPKRTDEDTVELIKRLAHHYPDAIIAGILSRQGRNSAHGERFTAKLVGSLRRHRSIPRYEPPAEPPKGELVNIRKAAEILKPAPSTIHRWLAEGFIAGEQITPERHGRFASPRSCVHASSSKSHQAT